MPIEDKFKTKTRIYIIGRTPSRCYDWLQGRGYLREGWRDPRVIVLAVAEQVEGLRENPDHAFVFLPEWTQGRAPDFKNMLWARLPHVMQANHVQ